MNKTALITGASEGLGFEFAKLCALDGYNLILIARNKEKLNAAAGLLKNEKINVTIIAKDLSKPNASEEIYKELSKKQIEVDILINNAGFGLYGRVDKIDTKKQSDEIMVNVLAATELTTLFVKNMVKKGSGKVLNVSSMAAFLPGPLMAVYYASKSDILSFTDATSYELRGTGVTLTALCPGTTKTGFETRANLKGASLFGGNVMSPQEVAKAGYEGMLQGKRRVVPGLMNKIIVFLLPLIPLSILLPIVESLHKH